MDDQLPAQGGFFGQDPASPDYQVNPLSRALSGVADYIRPNYDGLSARGLLAGGVQGVGDSLEGVRHLMHYMGAGPQPASEDSPVTGALKASDVLALAGLGIGTGALLGPAADASTAGMFLGNRSVGWDRRKVSQAESIMRQEGNTEAARHAVWDQTGLFKGADGQWRRELSDEGAAINTDTYPSLIKGDTIPFSQFLDHPELFKAYPFLGDMGVKGLTPAEATLFRAYFDQTANGGKGMIAVALGDPYETLSGSLHEGTHGIQGFQNWNSGGTASPHTQNRLLEGLTQQIGEQQRNGNMMNVRPLVDLKNRIAQMTPRQIYNAMGGEKEAVNVELRNKMRQQGTSPVGPPSITESLPRKAQLIMDADGTVSSPVLWSQQPSMR